MRSLTYDQVGRRFQWGLGFQQQRDVSVGREHGKRAKQIIRVTKVDNMPTGGIPNI